MASIAADSKYDLYVNGQLVVREGGLKRGPSPSGSYVDTVDLAEYLQAGPNSVAVLLWYFGRHGFSHRDSGQPGWLFDLDGLEIGPWKACRHPAYFDAGYVNDAYRLPENSVGFDARREMEGWTEVGYDDAAWPLAEPAGQAGCAPWGDLVRREFPQWHWSEERSYLATESAEAGPDGMYTLACQLPYNAQFLPVIELEAPAGVRIEVTVAQDTSCLRPALITREGRHRHVFPGWLNGEAAIYRLPECVRVHAVGYIETGYPAQLAGSFECGDAVLDPLWLASQRTVYLNMRDTFMDCPCRERAQWAGDLIVQLGQLPYCLDRQAELLVKKGLLETFRWQLENGIIYGPVPEGNWRMELPAQMLSVISPYGVWTYYMNSGDRATLEAVYAAAKRYFELWQFHDNGLIVYRPSTKGQVPVIVDGVEEGTWDWIDWGEKIDAEPALNGWFVLAAMGMRQMAAELGQTADAEAFGAREAQVRTAIREHYWDAAKGGYASADFEWAPDDRVQALMVLNGVAQAEQYPALLEVFQTVREACPYMERYVLEALFAMGQPAAALERMRSRYRLMLSKGNSTLWERWPEASEHPGTINHAWSGGPLTLLSSLVAGVRPSTPGWERIEIQPNPGDLNTLHCELATTKGMLSVQVRRVDAEWTVRLEIPDGAAVTLDTTLLSERGAREGIDPGQTTFETTLPAV